MGFFLVDNSSASCWATDEVLFDAVGRSYDRMSGKLLPIQPGRQHSTDLARFAIDNRFLARTHGLIDLLTDRAIGKSGAMPSALYVSDRQTFVSLNGSSARYVPLFGSPLDAEVAQLFAEVVTCHQLDSAEDFPLLKETEWEERRRKLIARLDEHSAPPLISRLAADRWHWLRRQEGRARPPHGAPASEEELKYLDRLVAIEPTWQNYDRRAVRRFSLNRLVDAAQDFLEAGRLAGKGYWHRTFQWPHGDVSKLIDRLVDEPILTATDTPEKYQLGLRLAEKFSAAAPEAWDRHVLVAVALYRLGRYNDALLRLEPLHRERNRAIISQMGRFFLSAPWPTPLFEEGLDASYYSVLAIAYWAMAHVRLGHPDIARAALEDLRKMLSPEGHYENLLREVETLIEGKPRPNK